MSRFLLLSCVVSMLTAWKVVECTCQFPSNMHGFWKRTLDNNVLEINSLNVFQFPIDNYKLDMHCYLNSGSKYVLKSNLERMFDEQVWIYVCWDITQITSTSFTMYDLSEPIGNNKQERGRAFLQKDPTVPSLNSICTRSSNLTPINMNKLN